MRCEGSGAEALDGGEDVVGGLGPAERLGGGVVGVEIGVDRGFELHGGAMDAAAQGSVGEQGEEALDLVEPGRRGRGEVEGPARMPGELCMNLGDDGLREAVYRGG